MISSKILKICNLVFLLVIGVMKLFSKNFHPSFFLIFVLYFSGVILDYNMYYYTIKVCCKLGIFFL